jgi:cation transport ATPase
MTTDGPVKITSGDIRVGMLIQVKANERLPADMLVIYAK